MEVQVWAVEAECRRFPSSSMASFFKEIDITGSERNRLLKKISEVAGNASRRIWITSSNGVKWVDLDLHYILVIWPSYLMNKL